MKGVSELKSRMQGIQDTVKITKAMYLLSASKMPKLNQRLSECQEWENTLSKALDGVCDQPSIARYYEQKEGCTGYLVFASDKGLCGDYNEKVRSYTLEQLQGVTSRKIYAVGNMARDFLKRSGIKCNNAFVHAMQSPMLPDAEQIAKVLLDEYASGNLTGVEMIYTHSLSAGNQEVVSKRLLPLSKRENATPLPLAAGEGDLEGLVYNDVVGKVYLALLEAATALNFKRMTTMHTATDNATEILEEMTLQMNHLRQDGITNELSDVNTAKIANEDRQ